MTCGTLAAVSTQLVSKGPLATPARDGAGTGSREGRGDGGCLKALWWQQLSWSWSPCPGKPLPDAWPRRVASGFRGITESFTLGL